MKNIVKKNIVKKNIVKKIMLVSLCASLCIGGISYNATEAMSRSEIAQIKVDAQGKMFKYWKNNSVVKQRLIEFVKEATNPRSANFIPMKDRIATFDMDGTLIGETAPYYYEWMLYLDRVYNDPSYKASPEILADSEIIKKAVYERTVTSEIDAMETKNKATILAGLNDEEFAKVVEHCNQQKVYGMKNITYGEMIYLPMAEVVSYLQANGFTIYIVTGADRQIAREFVKGALPAVATNHIIGADVVIKATNQGDTPGGIYKFDVKKDEIIRTAEILERNENGLKAIKIAREIGKIPVLSFGNSTGDFSMHQYTLSNKKYKTMAFEILCDDVEREYGNQEKAEKVRKLSEECGWQTISMRDDWKTIYGEEVVKEK